MHVSLKVVIVANNVTKCSQCPFNMPKHNTLCGITKQYESTIYGGIPDGCEAKYQRVKSDDGLNITTVNVTNIGLDISIKQNISVDVTSCDNCPLSYRVKNMRGVYVTRCSLPSNEIHISKGIPPTCPIKSGVYKKSTKNGFQLKVLSVTKE